MTSAPAENPTIAGDRMNKPQDSWWTVLAIDPLATRIVPRLSPLASVTPMRLTLVAFALGLASVVAFGTGELVLGAILFEVRFLLDCLDGKLARYRGTSSRAGAFVDVSCDMLVVSLCFSALAASLLDDAGAARTWLVAGIPLVTASAWLQLYRDVRHGESDRGVEVGWLARRRLKAYPSVVEAETASLFLGPLLLPRDWLVVVMLACFAFYALSIADNMRRIYRASVSP